MINYDKNLKKMFENIMMIINFRFINEYFGTKKIFYHHGVQKIPFTFQLSNLFMLKVYYFFKLKRYASRTFFYLHYQCIFSYDFKYMINCIFFTLNI